MPDKYVYETIDWSLGTITPEPGIEGKLVDELKTMAQLGHILMQIGKTDSSTGLGYERFFEAAANSNLKDVIFTPPVLLDKEQLAAYISGQGEDYDSFVCASADISSLMEEGIKAKADEKRLYRAVSNRIETPEDVRNITKAAYEKLLGFTYSAYWQAFDDFSLMDLMGHQMSLENFGGALEYMARSLLGFNIDGDIARKSKKLDIMQNKHMSALMPKKGNELHSRHHPESYLSALVEGFGKTYTALTGEFLQIEHELNKRFKADYRV